MGKVKQTLIARRSIRVFDGEPIPEEVMRDCLRDAVLAPSSSNLQPYELYWVRDSTTRTRLAEACLDQPAATTAGELVVVMARRDQWKTNLDKVWDLMTQGGWWNCRLDPDVPSSRLRCSAPPWPT